LSRDCDSFRFHRERPPMSANKRNRAAEWDALWLIALWLVAIGVVVLWLTD
jgi:hypothetical protein